MGKSNLEELIIEMGIVLAECDEVPQEEADEVIVYGGQGTTVK